MLGLAEMMNFPGVIAGDEAELAKLELDGRRARRRPRAGRPRARSCNAYAAAGIRSDHEALTVEEGRERLRAGMWLLDPRGVDGAEPARRCCRSSPSSAPSGIAFCTDDRDPEDIADDGHINGMVREAVAAGIAPEDALVMASHNPALWHGLRHHGAIAPGYQADLLVLPDLVQLRARARAQARAPDRGDRRGPRSRTGCKQSVRIKPVSASRLRDRLERRRARA